MLNPRSYLEDCLRQAKMNLWATAFPWDLVSQCIIANDEQQYRYDPGLSAQLAWELRTGRRWNNLHDPLSRKLQCPLCSSTIEIPWTTAISSMLYSRTNPGQIRKTGFAMATGYCDHSFSATCPNCAAVLDHEYLAVLKFKADVQALRKKELPLPGTLFTPNGVVKTKETRFSKWPQLTPNYLFLSTPRNFVSYLEQQGKECRTIRQLADGIYEYVYRRNWIIKVLDKDTQLANSDMFETTKGRGRGTLRRMMSRYWGGNSSLFALDLVGAVVRQGKFVQKMHDLDWIHKCSSSELIQFLKGFQEKYDIFWEIIVANPSRMAVPTLDVDLVWHTHQLSPKDYYKHSITTTTKKSPVRFIDHNDRVHEGQLSDSFEWTAKQYRKASGGKDYSECSCWYCEATRIRGVLGRLSKPSANGKSMDKSKPSDEVRNQTSPDISSHISIHNGVRAEGLLTRKRIVKRLNRIMLKYYYEKHDAEEAARRLKAGLAPITTLSEALEKLPRLHKNAYVKHAGCLSVNAGAAGNCIGGACSPSMAAGNCGGSMFKTLNPVWGRNHGNGFGYITGRGGGAGGGAGCGAGCGGS